MRSKFTVGRLIFSLLVFSSLCCRSGVGIPKGVNGGVACAACTAVIALTEQMTVIYNETFVQSYDRLCRLLPAPMFRNACIALGEHYIPEIVKILIDDVTADVVCHGIGLCFTEQGLPFCHAFPPKEDFKFQIARSKKRLAKKVWGSINSKLSSGGHKPRFNPCTLPGVKNLCQLFEKVFTNDKPLIDPDKDSFSSLVQAWRGISWRGKDCNDGDPMIYPGAKPLNGDIWFDSNCNGIKGVDLDTGRSYEHLLCSGWYLQHCPPPPHFFLFKIIKSLWEKQKKVILPPTTLSQ